MTNSFRKMKPEVKKASNKACHNSVNSTKINYNVIAMLKNWARAMRDASLLVCQISLRRNLKQVQRAARKIDDATTRLK